MTALNSVNSFCCLFICLTWNKFVLPIVAATVHPIVETELGRIQGSILETRLGRQFYSFRGIRYAKAPVDSLRFQVSRGQLTIALSSYYKYLI